ncbi:GNAT family N-acetyltransferase [Mucilaginibacter sp. SP1R1]|uniref:GNAT family N-acetyltransferase n=1 Tax=Mucilaginibacter sp. SP1R1 TaxID=2723091 RepID=UPI0016104E5D|nr:GNAT family N-acetyltransferase [Mucilaginibacter sp. SP1R1]MBB6148776.1 ribosomal protein S18 acetylase RimI-like enzyme [Mucilaginibacter sp. SP1R1]
MRSKIYDFLDGFIKDSNGKYKINDLGAYVDKIIEKGCIISIIEKNILIGFICYYANDYETNVAYLSILLISPLMQDMGYGRRLMEFSIADIIRKGFKKCCLEVADDNTKAIKLYEKLGFGLIEKRDTSLIMQKVL